MRELFQKNFANRRDSFPAIFMRTRILKQEY
jgi:hypothetical protein